MPPDGWRRVALGEIAARVTRRNTADNDNVLTISARDGLVSQEEYFNKRVASRDVGNYFHLKRGEFAYSKSFSQGYPAGAIKRLRRYDEGVVSPLYMCFSVSHRDVDADFLARYLESDPFYGPLRNIAKQGARAHGLLNVRPEDFFSIGVMLPPLAEQRRIAEILQATDDAVAAAEAVIDQTEKVKRGLVEQLLTRGIPGRHSRFKMTESGEVPESWRITTLGDELETFSGGTPSRSTPAFFDGDIPWLKSGEIRAGEIWTTEEAISEPAINASATKVASAGTVVLAMYGATAGVVGRLMIDAAINQAVLAFRESSTILPDYLRFLLEMLGPALLSRVQGSGQPNLSAGLVRSCACALPPLDEQADIIAQVVAWLGAVNDGKQTLASADRVRHGLAAELLSGRKRAQ